MYYKNWVRFRCCESSHLSLLRLLSAAKYLLAVFNVTLQSLVSLRGRKVTSSSSRATAWVRFVRALQAALSATQSQLVCAMVMPSAEDHSFRHPWNFASSCAISTVFFLATLLRRDSQTVFLKFCKCLLTAFFKRLCPLRNPENFNWDVSTHKAKW